MYQQQAQSTPSNGQGFPGQMQSSFNAPQGQPGYITPQGQPGYITPQGQPGYITPQGQPGYIAPPVYGQPGQSSGPCCGCMPLKTGTVVIGIVSIIRAVFYIGVFGYAAAWYATLINIGKSLRHESFSHSSATNFKIWPFFKDDPVIELSSVDAGFNVAIIGIFLMIIFLVTSGILICGAVSKNRTLCMIWFIGNFFNFIAQIFVALILFQSEFASDLISILLDVYFIVVVVYYIQELGAENRPQGQGQRFMPPTQTPLMTPEYGSYNSSNATFGPQSGPPPPYSQTQSQTLMQ